MIKKFGGKKGGGESSSKSKKSDGNVGGNNSAMISNDKKNIGTVDLLSYSCEEVEAVDFFGEGSRGSSCGVGASGNDFDSFNIETVDLLGQFGGDIETIDFFGKNIETSRLIDTSDALPPFDTCAGTGNVDSATSGVDTAITSFASAAATASGSTSVALVDNDGFQKVMSASEVRNIKKMYRDGKIDAGAPIVKFDPVQMATERKAIEEAFRNKLKISGIDQLDVDVTPEMARACNLDVADLSIMIHELENAIRNAPLGVPKPVENLSVDRLKAKIKHTQNNLIDLKAGYIKGKDANKDKEVETAIKEAEVFIRYLLRQITVVRNYQEMKSYQNTLNHVKKFCQSILQHKKVASSDVKPQKGGAITKFDRQLEYALGVVNSIRKVPLTIGELTHLEVQLSNVGERFNHPYNYLKRIKHKFFVHLDKTAGSLHSTSYSIFGFKKEVEDCAAFLLDIDFHKAVKIPIDLGTFRFIITDVAKFEEDFHVMAFFYAGNFDIIGKGDNINEAAAFVKSRIAKNESLSAVQSASAPISSGINEGDVHKHVHKFDYLICKALSSRFRRLIRDLETEHDVTINFEMTPKDPNALVCIHADLSNVNEDNITRASEDLVKLVNSMGYEQVKQNLTEDDFAYIFSEAVQRRQSVSLDICTIRYNGHVYIVGKKHHLSLGLERLRALLNCQHDKPTEFVIPKDKIGVLTSESLIAIQEWTGSFLEFKETSKGDVLLIFGDKQQKEECIKQVNDIFRTHVSTQVQLSPAQFMVVAEDKYRFLRDLETNLGISITISKSEGYITVSGQKHKVDDCLVVLRDFRNSFIYLGDTPLESLSTKEDFYGCIRLKPKQVGTIIGKGGSTKRLIIEKSGVHNIMIKRGNDSQEIVIIHGDSETISEAINLISQELETNSQTVANLQQIAGNKSDTVAEKQTIMDAYSSKNSFLRKSTTVQPVFGAARGYRNDVVVSGVSLLQQNVNNTSTNKLEQYIADSRYDESFPMLG